MKFTRTRRRVATVSGVALAFLFGPGLVFAGAAHASGVVWDPGYRQIVNAETRYCADVKQEDGGNTPGARVQQWNCTGVAEQHWFPHQVAATRDVFTFTSGQSHFCLDVRNGSTAPGALIQQWPCNGTAAQEWQVMTTGEIVSRLSGQCLDTVAGSKGASLMQWPCNGNIAQRWFIWAF